MSSTDLSASKKVCFDEIEILEFHYILGDNPAVSSGAPIALGSELIGRSKLEVDFYENNRGKRKSRKKLALPVTTRAQLLLSQGYSLESIASATLAAETISRERLTSASKQNWDRVNEVGERFGRVIRKVVGNKRSPNSPESESKIFIANSA